MAILNAEAQIWFLPCVAVLSFLVTWYLSSSGKPKKHMHGGSIQQCGNKPNLTLVTQGISTQGGSQTTITVSGSPGPSPFPGPPLGPVFKHYLAATRQNGDENLDWSGVDYSALEETAPDTWRTLRERGWLDQRGTPTKKWFGGKGE